MASTKKTTPQRSHKKKPAATANASTANTAPSSGSNRNFRPPAEELARICAQRAERARGPEQAQWFELGSVVGQWWEQRQQQTAPQQSAQTEVPRAMAAGA